MINSYLTNIHTRKIKTENVIFHNLYISKYCTIMTIVKKTMSLNSNYQSLLGLSQTVDKRSTKIL